MKILLAIGLVMLLSGCTIVSYDKKDGNTRFRYYSTKDTSFDKIDLDKFGSIRGASTNASDSVGSVADAVSDAAKLLSKP